MTIVQTLRGDVGHHPMTAPEGLPTASLNAIMRTALEECSVDGCRVSLDKQARNALHRAATVYLLYLGTIAEERRIAAKREAIHVTDMDGAFLDTCIVKH